MKIVLISPALDSGLSEMREPHLGLAYIAAKLLQERYEVKVIDAKTLQLKTSEVITLALKEQPQIIGITAMTPDILSADTIAKEIKKKLDKVTIIIGGPHATALPRETLLEFPSFDIVIVGEGEFTVFDLIKSLSMGEKKEALQNIKGIAFRANGTIVLTPPRERINDLDSLPFPAWQLFPKVSAYPIYATRGCPFQCIFCMRVLGSKVRKRHPTNIIAEIEKNLTAFGSKFFWFSDETFGVDPRWTNELLDLMISRKINERLKWMANSRANLANYDLYLKMRRAGCETLEFGIESGNPNILHNSSKGFTLEHALNAIKVAKKAGLRTGTFFIIGHPYETLSTAWDTIKFAAKVNSTTVSFGIMVPYPGTKIWDMANRKEGGYTYISKNWNDYMKQHGRPLGLASLTPEKLEQLQILAYLVFYLRNMRIGDLITFMRLHRKSIFARMKRQFKGLWTSLISPIKTLQPAAQKHETQTTINDL